MAERIHPAPDLKSIPFPKYQRAIIMMHAEGLYDAATGWAPASRERIQELLAVPTSIMLDCAEYSSC